jgi:hypothetical protein
MAAVIGAGIDEKLKAFPSLTHDQKQNIHI